MPSTRSRPLTRRTHRQSLVLTLSAAAATLVVVAALVGGQFVRGCTDGGGLSCLRDAVGQRLAPPALPAPNGIVETATQPAVPELPAPAAEPALPAAVAEAPAPVAPATAVEAVAPTVAAIPAYQPDPAKVERQRVDPSEKSPASTPQVADVPDVPFVPAETGSIPPEAVPELAELQDVPALALPQLPPPPLPPAALSVPPVPVAPAATPAGPSEPPSEAVAIAEPVLPAMPVPAVADVSPLPDPAVPEVAVTPPEDPTIDTISLDENEVLVGGEGPEDVVIRLYVDDELVGESDIVEGRWLVSGVPLFESAIQVLRAEALDPASGEVLGETIISLELQLPEPDILDEPGGPAGDADMTKADIEADAVPIARVASGATASAVAAPPVEPAAPSPTPVVPAPPQIAESTAELTPAPQPGPVALPPLRVVVPSGESASVTILPVGPVALRPLADTSFSTIGD